ncbi:MAG TPA: DinB family protein [Gemmatimonadaceae bacterium]
MASSLRTRPAASEYAPFYQGYVASVPEGDVVTLLRQSGRELLDAVAAIPEDRGGFRYADGKWSIREVIGHLIDAERIFTYRALRIARGDTTPLAAFDENEYVKTADSDARTLSNLARELGALRESSVQLFESLPDDAWGRFGVASGKDISVRALAYITAGHAMHHLRILRERYGVR